MKKTIYSHTYSDQKDLFQDMFTDENLADALFSIPTHRPNLQKAHQVYYNCIGQLAFHLYTTPFPEIQTSIFIYHDPAHASLFVTEAVPMHEDSMKEIASHPQKTEPIHRIHISCKKTLVTTCIPLSQHNTYEVTLFTDDSITERNLNPMPHMFKKIISQFLGREALNELIPSLSTTLALLKRTLAPLPPEIAGMILSTCMPDSSSDISNSFNPDIFEQLKRRAEQDKQNQDKEDDISNPFS